MDGPLMPLHLVVPSQVLRLGLIGLDGSDLEILFSNTHLSKQALVTLIYCSL